MLYRVQYLFAILLAGFAAIYLVFGIAGWNDYHSSNTEPIMPFFLCGLFLLAAGVLFTFSYRLRSSHWDKLDKRLLATISSQTAITPDELASICSVPLGDVHEYLHRAASQNKLRLAIKDGHTIVRVFPVHSLN